MAVRQRKPSRSLRTILIIWFILFSVVPLAFLTGYSIIKYQKAIDFELAQRLNGNAREINSILADFKTSLQQKRSRYIKDNGMIYHLSTEDVGAVKKTAIEWLKSDFSSSLTFFNRDGRMLVSVFKDEKDNVRDFAPTANSAIFLSEDNLNKLQTVKNYAFVEFNPNHKLSLIYFSEVLGAGKRTVGYIEQMIQIDQTFIDRLKQRMKLELIFVKSSGQVYVATHPDFYDYQKETFLDYIKNEKNNFFDLNIRSNPYGFVIYPISWGQTDLYLALGASKIGSKEALKKVNYAFFSVAGAIILLLIITIILASKNILKPLEDLVSAIDQMRHNDKLVEIPIKSDTEIGLLTDSFNELSRSVLQAKDDLKKKIAELENANAELKDTQARLIHSSKMVSLGQLVAGVAHELNNPIGFIHSNMNHLKDYSEKLILLTEAAEKNPQDLAKLKEQYELEYIKSDMPKLIDSCVDGARRTRDIVLGLRNFSRLEEAQLKEIDIHESIDNTLNLLAGEIKNRIQIIKDYGHLPIVTCFASQVNQVFMNILSNAVQAIEGKGNIWITTKNITSAGQPAKVQISIQDSGSGMPPEIIEKIFDPFFSTKDVGVGTGLGLSISYGIIQSHGGEIHVRSQVGIGTEFVVTLPVKYSPKDN